MTFLKKVHPVCIFCGLKLKSVLCVCSAAVQQCLMTSSVWEAIRAVDSMAALDAGLSESGCSHLQDFLRETLFFWHKIIKDRLAR